MTLLHLTPAGQREVASYLATMVDGQLSGRTSCPFERQQLEAARSRALDAILQDNAQATGYANALNEIQIERNAA